ncbi:MAG: hypothetical protein ACJAYU_000433 [Bradymonadia bacterium]|jgi:hypothetical protein
MNKRFALMLMPVLVACASERPTSETVPAAEPVRLVINEVYAHGGMDWFEIYNVGSGEVDLSQVSFFTREESSPRRVSSDAFLEPNEFYYVPVRDFEIGVGLDDADEVTLIGIHGAVLDRVQWSSDSTVADRSFGRFPDGARALSILERPTPGDANEGPTHGLRVRSTWVAGR